AELAAEARSAEAELAAAIETLGRNLPPSAYPRSLSLTPAPSQTAAAPSILTAISSALEPQDRAQPHPSETKSEDREQTQAPAGEAEAPAAAPPLTREQVQIVKPARIPVRPAWPSFEEHRPVAIPWQRLWPWAAAVMGLFSCGWLLGQLQFHHDAR